MKLVWSPETASKAYIETVQQCKLLSRGSGVPELISAMAAGWKAKLILETWSSEGGGGGVIETSIGLSIARKHTCGRHVCIVPNEKSKLEYSQKMGELLVTSTEIIVGEAEEIVKDLIEEIDFMVVDCKGIRDFSRVLKVAKLSVNGAVLVCKNASLRSGNFKWENVVVEKEEEESRRVVRSVFLPVGMGVDIAHVSAVGGNLGKDRRNKRWIKHVDQRSGEMHVIRR